MTGVWSKEWPAKRGSRLWIDRHGGCLVNHDESQNSKRFEKLNNSKFLLESSSIILCSRRFLKSEVNMRDRLTSVLKRRIMGVGATDRRGRPQTGRLSIKIFKVLIRRKFQHYTGSLKFCKTFSLWFGTTFVQLWRDRSRHRPVPQ